MKEYAMAQVVKTKAQKKFKKDEIFPFEKQNYLIIGAGLLLIIAGYVALSGNSVEGFFPLVLAPALLVLGYCVVIPIGILYKRKPKEQPVVGLPPPQ